MYVGKLFMAEEKETDPNDASHAINALLSALRMNGQVCGKEWPIAIISGGYEATVLLPESDALGPVHHNGYVRRCLLDLREAGLAEPVYTVAREIEDEGSCPCAPSPSFVLYTNYLSLDAPLRCGGCFKPVPLYRIAPTKNEEYNDIICWQSYYQACDTLQMNCTPMEGSAMRQLYRLESGLTKAGLEVCRRVAELTQTPAYYYLYRYGARSLKQERKRLCPSCQGEWLLPEPWHLFDFKCDRCFLLSNIAWDVRPPDETL